MGEAAQILNNFCNISWADANATGIYTFTPGVQTAFDYPVSAAITLHQNATWTESAIWLNTGGSNYNNADKIAYDVCLIGLPSPKNESLYRAWARDDQGDCSQAYDSSCIEALSNAISSQANNLISNPGTNANNPDALPNVCQSVGQDVLNNLPDECTKYLDSTTADGPGVYTAPLTNFGSNSSALYGEPQCVSGPNNIPLNGPYNYTDPDLYWSVGELSGRNHDHIYATSANRFFSFVLLFTPLVGEENDRSKSSAQTVAKPICLRASNYSANSYEPPPPPNPNPSKLSGGDIAGIVVGSVAGAAIILGLLFWLWRRRRNQRQRQLKDDEKPVVPELAADGTTNELEADSAKAEELPTEKYGLAELQQKRDEENELPAEEIKHEMEGETAIPLGELPANEAVPLK